MSIRHLRERIIQGIESSDRTESSRYRHHQTALNMLLKTSIVLSEDELEQALSENLSETIEKLRMTLERQGKSDTRSPLTRVRRLAEFYAEINNIDFSRMTFCEALAAAVQRKYGERLWLDEVTPKTQNYIKKNFITYREVAREIINTSLSNCPEAWPILKSSPQAIGSATKVLRDYMMGTSHPAERVPDIRINFIESFLNLPRNLLLDKIHRKVDHQRRGKNQSDLDRSAINRSTFISSSLNPNLQKVYDEYCEYKINKKQPSIINVSDELRSDRRYELRARVNEKNRRNNEWTINAKGACGSAIAFKSQLLSFQHFCHTELGIDYMSVSSYHMTIPEIMQAMAEYSEGLQTGTSQFSRILNFVKRGSESKGYLRFCADRGNRTIEEFFKDLDFIIEEYPNWFKMAEKGIDSRGQAGKKGKLNIQFLLNIPASDRRNAVYRASQWLFYRAKVYKTNAEQKIVLSNNTDDEKLELTHRKSAASQIGRALQYFRAGLIQTISFYQSPRSANWTELKFYPNATSQNKNYASITYHRQRNRFQLYIPCFGSSMVSDDNTKYRYLKNANAKNSVDVDVELPEQLTPLIKEYLNIRRSYIEFDLMTFAGVQSVDDIDIFFPWRSIRQNQVKNEENLKIRSKYIEASSKLSDNFKSLTYQAYLMTMPHDKQHGINIHALRHLVAETHLEEHPGDFIGAAAKLNDDVEQIIKTYGDKDRAKAMRRVSDNEKLDFSFAL